MELSELVQTDTGVVRLLFLILTVHPLTFVNFTKTAKFVLKGLLVRLV